MKQFCIRLVKPALYYISTLLSRLSSDKPMLPIDVAVGELQRYSPEPSGSMLCKNTIAPEYDLTIIIPVYNVEAYIEECVTSVLNQKTQYQYHIVIVNDGSTDRTVDIINKFRYHERVTVIDQENGGISAARNVAMRGIRSRYIMFVDSDDFLTESAVETLISAAQSRQADVVQGSYYNFYDTDTTSKVEQKYKDENHVPPNGVISGMAWGKVFNSSLFEHVCFPADYYYEDTIITGIVSHMANNIATIPDVVYAYRRHQAAITERSKIQPKSIDTLWITRLLLHTRAELGMKTDTAFYHHLLRQAVLNYQRTLYQPEQIKRSIFAVTREMLMQECPVSIQLSGKYKTLDSAIRNGKYALYTSVCRFW